MPREVNGVKDDATGSSDRSSAERRGSGEATALMVMAVIDCVMVDLEC